MPISAWYMDDDTALDQREPHRAAGDSAVPMVELDKLGVLSWEGIAGPDCPRLASMLKMFSKIPCAFNPVFAHHVIL